MAVAVPVLPEVAEVAPVPEDAHSYLLLTLVKAPDNDDELETIPDTADFRSFLNSASFRRV